MNGAESLVRTLVGGGVNVCFANPGSSEMLFVAALGRVDGMRCVLGLFEGVVTGAADGYYRMTGNPAVTLLHLGPGLGNGLANIHNANKAASGMVNIVGDHATYHRQYDAPLTSDIEGLARPSSHWVKTSPDAMGIAKDGAEAITQARTPPGQIASLILPADTAWNDGSGAVAVPPPEKPAAPAPVVNGPKPAPATGDITSEALGASIGALLPENAIVADEAVTTGRGFFAPTKSANPHDWMSNMGGSIGLGMPLATGAAVACPDRRVVSLQADGSAMYTVQALWTQAREALDITTVLFSNRTYQILKGELANVGPGNPGRKALDMLDLGRPDIDWVGVARSLGVPGARVTTMEEFNRRFADAVASPGPFLVVVVL